MRLTTILIILPILTACGATAPTTPTSNTATFTTVSVFSDGAGVFRALGTEETGVGISPRIAEEVAIANNDDSTSATSLDPSSFSLVSSNSLGTIREGAFTVGSTAANVTVYQNVAETASLIHLSLPLEGSLIISKGAAMSGLPTGTFNYTGQHAVGVRSLVSDPEAGTFSLDANFTSNTFVYGGVTATTTLGGSGIIDSAKGRFASNALTLTTSGGDYTAKMYGLFHGADAADVTGVFHTNDNNPDFAGGFVGSR